MIVLEHKSLMNDLHSLDLNLLKALDALLDTRSVTLAAQHMGVTQPAMSGMLVRLRQAFGDPLFVRLPRGMAPTDHALSLSAPLKQLLEQARDLIQPPRFEPSQATQSFVIAATDYALRSIVVPLLAALRPRAPGIRLSLRPLDPGHWVRQLEHGDIDMALTTPEVTPENLHARRLFDEHYVCALRGDHPALRSAPGLDLDTFCQLDHALVSYAGDRFEGVTDRALERHGRTRRVTLALTSFLVLPDILRSSDLVAVVPSRLLNGVEGLMTCTPPLTIPGFTKSLAWHARQHHDPAHQWLRRLLAASCLSPAA